MQKSILISGIQPTGSLHIGNYLGALKNFVDLQNSEKYDCYFFVADYHSLTDLTVNSKERKNNIENLLMEYLAAGLDPQKSTIFIQSQVQETTELAWILSALTSFGELSRMTQFKDKASNQNEVNAGLFNYPILMAADILLFDAEFVPIGEDQLQHLELTRTIVRKFNSKYGNLFKEPKALLTPTPRVMSLSDSSKKMSKSEPQGCVFLEDSPETIKSKIKRAETDSGNEIKFDEKNKPAISNLLSVFEAFSGKSIKILEKEFKNKNYSEFKDALSKLLSESLQVFRDKKKTLNNSDVLEVAKIGKERLMSLVRNKMALIKNKIGLN